MFVVDGFTHISDDKGFVDYISREADPLTAGRAKKEIPRSAQKAAISFPGHVIGTVSP